MVVDVEPRLDCLIGDEAVEYYRSIARTRDSGKCGTSGETVRGIGSDASASRRSRVHLSALREPAQMRTTRLRRHPPPWQSVD